jgi:hypothetical protein
MAEEVKTIVVVVQKGIAAAAEEAKVTATEEEAVAATFNGGTAHRKEATLVEEVEEKLPLAAVEEVAQQEYKVALHAEAGKNYRFHKNEKAIVNIAFFICSFFIGHYRCPNTIIPTFVVSPSSTFMLSSVLP